MRHTKARGQLNRFSAWRKATVVSMAKNLLKYESINTTLVRARVVQPVVEHLIADARTDTVANRRRSFAVLGEHGLVNILYTEIAPRFKDVNGGYTRILKLGKRRGDNAELALFELTKKKEKKVKAKAGKAAKAETVPEGTAPEGESAEKKAGTETKEKPPVSQKPPKKFLGGIRKIFKKERDSL
ncbi:MAG: 50S ribosomal protein L17 [Deltaproteobacteria bacterium]